MATRAKKKPAAAAKSKTTSAKKSAKVVVTKMSIPFSPSGCALAPDGTRLIVSTDSRKHGEKAPSLVLFDLTKKRSALTLRDAGTVVLERSPDTEYMYGPPLWLTGDRIVFVRPSVKGKHELVVRGPVAGAPTSVLVLGASGSLIAADGDRVCVTSAKTSGGDHVCQIYALPEPGAPFGKPLYENKKMWPYAFAGGRLWMIGDDGVVGVDGDQRITPLPNAPQPEGNHHFAGHDRWLAYWKDYVLQGYDVENGTVSDIEDRAFTYKNAIATHGGRALVSTSTGELAIVSFVNKKVLWQKKVAGARSSPDHVAFAAEGTSAVAGATFEPFRIYKLTIS